MVLNTTKTVVNHTKTLTLTYDVNRKLISTGNTTTDLYGRATVNAKELGTAETGTGGEAYLKDHSILNT